MGEDTPERELQVRVVHVGEDGTQFVAVPAEWVQYVTDVIARIPAPVPHPGSMEVLMAKTAEIKALADTGHFNGIARDDNGVWRDTDGDEIIFTPYGYRKEKEVQDELERPLRS